MANVLVFGHQNPDNDAIMSAVVLSQLLNQVEYAGNTYEACALGQLPAESAKLLADARTIVWNGPVGAFETVPFDKGSRALADILADSKAYTLVCGGDTVAAVESFGVADKMGYLSTGGGAFLEVREGKTLPAVAALADAASK